jgi:hypothetical protein
MEMLKSRLDFIERRLLQDWHEELLEEPAVGWAQWEQEVLRRSEQRTG